MVEQVLMRGDGGGILRTMPMVKEKKARVRKAKELMEPLAAEAAVKASNGLNGRASLHDAVEEAGLVDALDPVAAAKAAGLRYVTDRKPGIRRHAVGEDGKQFEYTADPDWTPVTDEATLGRIKSLVIPPAWTDVWISKQPNGHLQTTGRDARAMRRSMSAWWRLRRRCRAYVSGWRMT